MRKLTLTAFAIATCFVAVTALVACTQTGYQAIDASQAKSMIDSNTEVVILDVRTQEEFDQGHIFAAVLLPVSDIPTRASELLPDKDVFILVYCRSGNRSVTAAQMLVDLGYRHVFEFGGIVDPPWPYELQGELQGELHPSQ